MLCLPSGGCLSSDCIAKYCPEMRRKNEHLLILSTADKLNHAQAKRTIDDQPEMFSSRLLYSASDSILSGFMPTGR